MADSRPMRIAFLNPVGTLGGAERCLLSMLTALRQADAAAELHLLALADGPLLSEADQLGVRTHALPMPRAMARMGDSALRGQGALRRSARLVRQALAAAPGLPRYVCHLRRMLTTIGPHLIHSNGLKTHLLARLAVPAGTPVVWHVHDFLGQRPVMARVLRWAARRAAGAIAVSEAVRRDAASVLGPLPLALIHNVVDVEHFRPAPGDGALLDRLANLPPAPASLLRVGLVATYARWKGHDVFLDAAARLARERPEQPRFYIVGGPVYATRGSQFSEEELRAEAAARGIASRVGFIGFQRDVADVYRALDVVIHASTRPEPFGRRGPGRRRGGIVHRRPRRGRGAAQRRRRAGGGGRRAARRPTEAAAPGGASPPHGGRSLRRRAVGASVAWCLRTLHRQGRYPA